MQKVQSSQKTNKLISWVDLQQQKYIQTLFQNSYNKIVC